MVHLSYHTFQQREKKKQDTAKQPEGGFYIKGTTDVHAIRLQQTRVDLSEYCRCSNRYPVTICTPDVILFNVNIL